MNNLQVKTIELEPAKVVFNHEEIEKDLENNLKKYSGLTFTEDDATECNKTIAELRKGKKAVDRYRIDTKKELSAPITEFEKKCKTLNEKFDSVINPLVEQSNAFEEKRRTEKREKSQEVLAQIIEDFELDEKYAIELAIEDTHLAKSRSMKSIKEEFEMKAEHLKMKQEKEASDKQSIINQVKLSNAENDLTLSESSYLSLLDYKDVNQITEQITSDVDRELERERQAEQRKQEQLEREEKRKQERQERESQEPTVQEKKEPEPVIDPVFVAQEPIPFKDMEAR